jgi:hypothetical protein
MLGWNPKQTAKGLVIGVVASAIADVLVSILRRFKKQG